MSSSAPTHQLSVFAAELEYRDLPVAVQTTVHSLMLDYLRVASIGERMPWSEWARAYARQTAGAGAAPVLYGGSPLDPVSAVFLNTVYAGSLDADDVHVGAMLHPGCIVFSAALAIGQSRHISGERVLAAVVAGYEAMIRIALAIQPSHFKRGFQSTSTCGVFGAAVAAATLLATGSDRAARIADAIGIGASFCGGLTQFYHSGSTVKRIHAAQAASSGVRAALLVDTGFSGPNDILEGKDGFARAYADSSDFWLLSDGLGDTYRLLEVAVKPHACSARVLSAVEAAAGLCRTHGIVGEDVETITLGIPKVIQGRLTVNEPQDLQAAQMSAPFSVALAICKDTGEAGFALNVDDFDEGLRDPLVRHLAGLVECVLDSEVEQTSTSASVSARLTLTLKSGGRHSVLVIAPKGSASRPFAPEDHEARMRAELGRRYLPEHVDGVVAQVRALADSPDVARLATWLA